MRPPELDAHQQLRRNWNRNEHEENIANTMRIFNFNYEDSGTLIEL